MISPRKSEPPRRIRIGALEATLSPRAAYEAAFVADAPTVGFAFDPQTGRHALGSDRASHFERPAHTLAFTPAGCDVYSRSDAGGEYLAVAWRGGAADGALYTGRVGGDAFGAARVLRRMALAEPDIDPLAFQVAAAALFDRAAAPVDVTEDARRLTPSRRRRFEAAVEDGLVGRLTLDDLAAAVEMSPGRLSRAVKAVFGASPYDFVLERRIARARGLLRDRRSRLVDVALATGFCSHAHMTRCFTQRLGAPPSAFRR